MNRSAGFSLLELMVVVAIIGVLASVAVPRFNIFRARARQAEAKANLGVIFTLQEAFKIDKESYYDGVKGTWGGEAMNGFANRDGYTSTAGSSPATCSSGQSTQAACTGTWTAANAGSAGGSCKANKLGFRLANCGAARYGYYIAAAAENTFLAYAFAPSDANKRIFPGCAGGTPENTSRTPADSKSGKTKCIGTVAEGGTDGDAFCLDHARTVDNLVDIVGAGECVN